MKSRFIVLIVAAFAGYHLIVSLAFLLWIEFKTNTIAAGGGTISPDRRFIASLTATIEEKAFCETQSYYRFSVLRMPHPDEFNATMAGTYYVPVKTVRIPTERKDLKIMRGTSPFPIEWNDESTEVRTTIDNVSVSIQLIDETHAP